jgi:hypothetical protein
VRAGAGERIVVPAGARHRFENTGAEVAQLRVEADPALELQESIEDGVALARAEKFDAKGNPKSLRAIVEGAALARRYRDTVVLCSPPRPVQSILFPLLAAFASRRSRPNAVSTALSP